MISLELKTNDHLRDKKRFGNCIFWSIGQSVFQRG